MFTCAKGPAPRWGKRRKTLFSVLAAALLAVGFAGADVHITGGIEGDTVNFEISGLEAGHDYTVTVTHCTTHQANQYYLKSDDKGVLTGTGTPGESTIKPGQWVTVKVQSGQPPKTLAKRSIQKETPPAPSGGEGGAPWWAYTGVGTLIYWLFG